MVNWRGLQQGADNYGKVNEALQSSIDILNQLMSGNERIVSKAFDAIELDMHELRNALMGIHARYRAFTSHVHGFANNAERAWNECEKLLPVAEDTWRRLAQVRSELGELTDAQNRDTNWGATSFSRPSNDDERAEHERREQRVQEREEQMLALERQRDALLSEHLDNWRQLLKWWDFCDAMAEHYRLKILHSLASSSVQDSFMDNFSASLASLGKALLTVLRVAALILSIALLVIGLVLLVVAPPIGAALSAVGTVLTKISIGVNIAIAALTILLSVLNGWNWADVLIAVGAAAIAIAGTAVAGAVSKFVSAAVTKATTGAIGAGAAKLTGTAAGQAAGAAVQAGADELTKAVLGLGSDNVEDLYEALKGLGESALENELDAFGDFFGEQGAIVGDWIGDGLGDFGGIADGLGSAWDSFEQDMRDTFGDSFVDGLGAGGEKFTESLFGGQNIGNAALSGLGAAGESLANSTAQQLDDIFGAAASGMSENVNTALDGLRGAVGDDVFDAVEEYAGALLRGEDPLGAAIDQAGFGAVSDALGQGTSGHAAAANWFRGSAESGSAVLQSLSSASATGSGSADGGSDDD